MIFLDAKLRIYDASKGYCPPEWKWDNARTEQWRGLLLWLVKGGRATLTLPGITYELSRGDCLILRLDEEITGRHDPAHPLVVPWFHFDAIDQDGRIWTPDPDQFPQYRRIDRLSFLDELLDRCEEAFARRNPAQAAHWLRSALIEITEQDRRRSGMEGAEEELESRIEEICRLIRKTPEKWYRTAELAAYVYRTPDHFIRVFKQLKGITPGEFMIRTRIEAARNLLRFTNYSIARIADMLGYRDVYFFSKQFRQHTGLPPSRYRREEIT